jgi:enoyl-CoA hydratase/carnithine racemase
VRLPSVVGASVANDLLYTGRQIDAAEALRVGLLNAIVPSNSLMSEAMAKANEIAVSAPLAIRALKRALRASEGLPYEAASGIVAAERRTLDTTADYAEGLSAFAEKRDPRFTGH